MLTKRHFTTLQGLSDLLSVATYGNGWPAIKLYKCDDEKGLFNQCECREDKWATALLKGKGVVVYDCYELDEAETDEEKAAARHEITLDDVKRGLDLMKEKYPRHWADLVEEDDDLITGDVWLQLTVFGELIYG